MRSSVLAAACAALAIPFSACGTMRVRPVPFHAPAPVLGLTAGQKLPLRVAVFLPEPMRFRFYYTAPQADRPRRLDQTDQYGGEEGLPVGRELARLAAKTFPQAFQRADVLREPPGPGEYDAVIELAVTSIDEAVNLKDPAVGLDVQMWMDWKISIANKSYVETLARKRTTERRRFSIQDSFSAEPMFQAMGREGGALLSALIRDAALTAREHLAGRTQRGG